MGPTGFTLIKQWDSFESTIAVKCGYFEQYMYVQLFAL